MKDTAIKIENLSKKFSLRSTEQTLYHTLPSLFTRKKKNRNDFWALRDINLEVKKGEILGIIGRNGAGKSTLLKTLAKIYSPDSGAITYKGSLSTLLEVGIGFHPELTGSENIYLNGAILGMTKIDIKNKFDEIIDFAGIREFINVPVKRYSSGMYIRLAFSVAAHLDSDILLIDEVLAVGDMEFQKKCLRKMDEISSSSGRTILFVSHNLNSIAKLCTKSVLLSEGRIIEHGANEDVFNKYASLIQNTTPYVQKENDFLKIEALKVISNGLESRQVGAGEDLEIIIEYRSKVELTNFIARIEIYDNYGSLLAILNSRISNYEQSAINAVGAIQCKIKKLNINVGEYTTRLIFKSENKQVVTIDNFFGFSVVPGPFYKTNFLPHLGTKVLVDYNWEFD